VARLDQIVKTFYSTGWLAQYSVTDPAQVLGAPDGANAEPICGPAFGGASANDANIITVTDVGSYSVGGVPMNAGGSAPWTAGPYPPSGTNSLDDKALYAGVHDDGSAGSAGGSYCLVDYLALRVTYRPPAALKAVA
jgi:hypothetical protein